MKIKQIVGIAAIVAYTTLVGSVGFQKGKESERDLHKDDGLVLTVTGQEKPRIYIEGKIGGKEFANEDLSSMNYCVKFELNENKDSEPITAIPARDAEYRIGNR
jgi:hypothetical protein